METPKKPRTDAEALKLDPCADGCPRGCSHDLAPAKDYTTPTHTPGPWCRYEQFIIGPSSEIIAGRDGVSKADDARLIVAAPDLLVAAQNARNVLAALAVGDLKSIKADSPALAELRAAIEKAEGH